MKLGYLNKALLVHIVQNWYDACNQHGISVNDQIEWLLDMDKYLSYFYEPKKYPMNSKHIRGLPSSTYQAIHHNVCTQIQLYWLSTKHTY